MECPKCHAIIDDNATVCPYCHKVFLLECPNCHSLCESAVCNKCGYNILVKCSKCSKISNISSVTCPKCGVPLTTSLAYQECESDTFAAIVLKFDSMKNIRKALKSQELFVKFNNRIKNLLNGQFKNIDAKIISYDDIFVINFNKELSFQTSASKAVRFALKIANVFSGLNANVKSEFGIPLNLKFVILQKKSEELLELPEIRSNIKLLDVKKKTSKHIAGMQIILDQNTCDAVAKEYKTDSLYSIESEGKMIMFYEVILDNYVLPPNNEDVNEVKEVKQLQIEKPLQEDEKEHYSFNIFDIKAKCSFENVVVTDLLEKLSQINMSEKKIISINSSVSLSYDINKLREFYEKNDYKVLSVTCTEMMNYKPWAFFDLLLRDYYQMSLLSRKDDLLSLNQDVYNLHQPLFDLIIEKPVKAMTPEDARFAYMEAVAKFLSNLKNTVIIVDGFRNLDDTSIQTLELYFDKYKRIVPNFVFITTPDKPLHSKIKGLKRTEKYTELTLKNTNVEALLSTLNIDATDFIQSFYYEKIKENYKGSLLYFEQIIKYLEESGVLIEFNGKLLLKSNKSVVVPKNIEELYKARLKKLSQNNDASMIMALSLFFGARIDRKTFERIGIEGLDENIKYLEEHGFLKVVNDILYVNNYTFIEKTLESILKKDAQVFLAKKILAKLGQDIDDTIMINVMRRLNAKKEEYLTLWKNSQFAIATGDFDAYLKNCIGFLALIEKMDIKISQEDIEEHKKEVYENILQVIYNYSPTKIYSIENALLLDAIEEGNNEKIVKLSNLMLQGALLSSNYTDALGLLHNILSRTKNASMIVDGQINVNFFLLSLVHVEILYNIGQYKECVDISNEIIGVLNKETLLKLMPVNFSENLFVSHILDILKLAALSKMFLLEDDINEFFNTIYQKLQVRLPEEDCILAVLASLKSEDYEISNIEECSPYSKLIFLILKELLNDSKDYNMFAQNIYQAKLLAIDINQTEIELVCDLLIGYAYSKAGVSNKADAIFKDIESTSENAALFSTILLSKYFIALQAKTMGNTDASLKIISDMLALIQKNDNQFKFFYVLFEKLYIEILKQQKYPSADIDAEEQKIIPYKDRLSLLFN